MLLETFLNTCGEAVYIHLIWNIWEKLFQVLIKLVESLRTTSEKIPEQTSLNGEIFERNSVRFFAAISREIPAGIYEG